MNQIETTTSFSTAKTHVQTSKGDSNAGFACEIDVVEVCMGAPCYKLEGNMGDDSDGCQMACLCPIGAGELEPTFYDDALATDFTDQCFQATTVSTSWTPSLKQVNTLVDTLVKAGKDSAMLSPKKSPKKLKSKIALDAATEAPAHVEAARNDAPFPIEEKKTD